MDKAYIKQELGKLTAGWVSEVDKLPAQNEEVSLLNERLKISIALAMDESALKYTVALLPPIEDLLSIRPEEAPDVWELKKLRVFLEAI